MSSTSLPRIAAWGFLLFFVLGISLQLLSPIFSAWFVQVFVFLCIPWLFFRFARQAPAKALGLLAVVPNKAAAGAFLGMLCSFAVVWPLMHWMSHLFPAPWIERFDGRALFFELEGIERLLMVAAVLLAAPLGEEVFFRGFLQPRLMQRWGAPMGLLATSVLFSLIHIDPVGFLARVALGLLFGWLAYAGGSLWVSIAAHAAYNLLVCFLFFAVGPEASLGGAAFGQGLLLLWLGVGAGSMLGLLWLLGFSPPVAFGKPLAPALPPVVWWRLLRPWVLAAGGSFVLLVAVDYRGVALNVFDTVVTPFPRAAKENPQLQGEMERMRALRHKARKGQVALTTYFEFRRQLSLKLLAPET